MQSRKILMLAAALLASLSMSAVSADEKRRVASCQGNKTQRHAQVAKRYAIDKTYSLLSECGLGDLLNFGLDSLGLNFDIKGGDMCSKPLDYLAAIPAKEAQAGVNRALNDGVRRPVNKAVSNARRTVKTGSWYKDADWY